MLKRNLVILVLLFASLASVSYADDIENLFLRKAVKEYVAKDYFSAINDLKQVLVANPKNVKAQRLIVKSYINLGTEALGKNNGKLALNSFNAVLKYDAANSEALLGLEQAKSQLSSQRVAVAAKSSQPTRQVMPVQQLQPQVIYNQTAPTKTDSVQAKVIAGLFTNFTTQQKLFEKQIEASSKALANTEDSKEKYLTALIDESRKNSSMMKTYMLIGGTVALGIILLILLFFGIIFKSVAKASDLRTVQANETLQLLLANGSSSGDGASPLMLAGPAAKNPDALVTIDSLENEDPTERANAVEAIAAEIVDEKEDTRLAKIHKLEELLTDDNNRVRANAAKALYDIDKNLSLTNLIISLPM